MAIRNFPKCEVGWSLVGRMGPQYMHCSHVLLFADFAMLGTTERSAREEKNGTVTENGILGTSDIVRF